MKPSLSKIIILLVVGSMLFTFPQAVLAALTVASVTPSTVSNNQNTTLVVTGSDFQPFAVVSLDGYGALSTSYMSSTTLNALLPAGVPQGIYSLTVTNPDSTSATLQDALTVLDVVPTATSTPEPASGYERPVIVVASYSANRDTIYPGDDFTLSIKLYNAGQKTATNVVANFTIGDLIPRNTGGVVAAGDIEPDHRSGISQPFTLSTDAWGKTAASLTMTVTYTDENGISYSEVFTISVPVAQPIYSAVTPTPTATSTPTATPTLASRPQLVITTYSTNLSPLQPGTQFSLNITVQNVGTSNAKSVSMIVGGGSSSGSYEGTPNPGGVSGSTGEFTNFAPLGTSNVQSIGDLMPGESLDASQSLIVNVNTNPGAYPMKISFVYLDEGNHSYTDDQVITLLVFLLPVVEVNFYQEPGIFYTGQPNLAPLQIVNKGRNTVVLGNMKVTSEVADLSNNTILIGALEPGGYFTLDTTAMPYQAGTLDLIVTVDYTDDFNQLQSIEQTLQVEVMDMPMPEPGEGEFPNGEGEPSIPDQPETLWQKVWRFILGLFGLDSGTKTTPVEGEIIPVEEEVSPISPPIKMP